MTVMTTSGVKPPLCSSVKPIMGPIDMASVVDSPKYPMPSPKRLIGMTSDAMVGNEVLVMPKPMPNNTRISSRKAMPVAQ